MRQSLPAFPEMSFGTDRNAVRLNEAVCDVARRLWPAKTAANLASRADVEMRTAEMWLEGRNGISGNALTGLLRSDAGFDFMLALMDGSQTRWWREFRRGVQISELEKRNEWIAAQIAALKS